MKGFKGKEYSGMGLALRLALNISLPLVGGVLLGQFLGRRYGYEALFAVAGVLIGLLFGFRQALHMLLKK